MSCFTQTKDTYYGVTLTQISTDYKNVDTTRLLYVRNIASDRLSVYTVRDRLVSSRKNADRYPEDAGSRWAVNAKDVRTDPA
jgi:hypothetical protein